MKSHRFFIFAVIGIAAAIIAIAIYVMKLDFFSSLDLKLRDVRFRSRGNIEPPERVVIVAIDEKSINELGRWPWDRKVIAQLIDNLKDYGVKTVAFDIVFSEPSMPDQDKALSDAIRRSKNSVLGYFFRTEGDAPTLESIKYLYESRIKVIRIEDGVTEVPVYSFPVVELNIPLIGGAADGMGFFNIIPDSDGIIRNLNLLMLYDGYIYPSLSLSALRHYSKKEIVLDIRRYGVDNLLIGSHRIPCDESGRIAINYYGGKNVFRTIPAVDVIKNRIRPDELKNTLVFVGATETGIADVRATPVDPVLPGVILHATVVSNIMEGRFLIKNGRVMALDILSIVISTILLITLLTFMRRTVSALLVFVLITILYYLINLYLFRYYNLNTSIIYPVISITISYLGSEAYRNLIEEKQGRFLKKAFSSYVSPELVSEIISNPHLLKLGGEKRVVTILFSDVRDFTTISERLPPERLVSLLNRYLSPMTEIVLKYRGTLDKYIGDAIMAIYNAPVALRGHAIAAINTSIEMLDKLMDVNAIFKEEGLPVIGIGIGINTGECVVGNIGTHVRFDYTAIGDAVNLASRLEGLNKIYGTNIILSEYTLKELDISGYLKIKPYHIDLENGRRIYLRELDYIRVKGKEMPVRIFELMVVQNPEMIIEFLSGLELYRKRRFSEAINIFRGLSDDGPSMVYASRCEYFIENPPGENWDGVFTAREK